MIREVPNRYEKLNFSSDDIQKQLETQSQGSPECQGGISQGTINPIASNLIINSKESESMLDSQQSSSSPSQNVSLRADSNKTSRGSSASQQEKSIDQNYDDLSPSKRPAYANSNNKNGNANIIKQVFFKKLPTNSNNCSQYSLIKESLTNPFTQFKSKKSYYVESNPQNIRKRRLLSFHGEETGEFRELVTFLDKAKQGDEMPAHKMIRKNSCCCQNCGAKTTKEVKLDKLIPKFKPTQVIKMMYRRAFQKTISNVSKINKFFRSKLSIRTNNNNHFLFGEKKASPTKFIRQSTFKISPKSTEKVKQPQQKAGQRDLTENLQKLSSLNMVRHREGQLQQQSSGSQNESPLSINEQRSKKMNPTFYARNSLLVYSNGDQNTAFLSKLQQSASPFKKSSFQNNPQSNSEQPIQQQSANSNKNPQSPLQNIEVDKQAPPLLSNTSSGLSVSSSSGLNNMISNMSNNNLANNNSNQVSGSNTPQYPVKKKNNLYEKLELSKNKNNAQNIIVEDNIIDQLRQETKIGNINNEFVKSVGSNIIRQSLSNLPKDQQDQESDRLKSKRTLVILEDVSETAQNQEQEKVNKNLYGQSFYLNIPKLSNKYMNPVLFQLRSVSQNNQKKTGNQNLQSAFHLKTLADIPTDISIDKHQKFLINQSTPIFDTKSTTQTPDLGKFNQNNKSSTHYNQNTLKSFASMQNLKKVNKNSISGQNEFSTKKNESNLKNNMAEGSKKLQMKRYQKSSSQSSSQQFNSVYLQKSMSSCTQLSASKQKILFQNRPPFNLSLKNDSVRNNEIITLPIKLQDTQSKTQKSKLFDRIFNQKASLPEINIGSKNQSHIRDIQSQPGMQKDQNQQKNSESEFSQAHNQSFDNFSKGFLSPIKLTNKKKNVKSKSISSQNKNIFDAVELFLKKGNNNASYQHQLYINQNN
ncbi:hypothetical protein TTHERM_00790510 (macronuclear) [Tetrahymena thermophila SB210]|uniref:Uncharacterized protein n=1 Tax=Tetrahymena thermophila (strain SB210) TaxID=312017 RepID=Q24DT6_TETTS|nr:hypothetical protein TTHERM_00790510 [Tetrahymena thermophila SB210]EAS05904.1 hypothetical protein TTHERM_00790510 [Tetrahymena thermophila SB210]|eukprot:XP_001026149.1 hypothetical protein TTHERM_00790510 [Tetrahymena thermophila SB210]